MKIIKLHYIKSPRMNKNIILKNNKVKNFKPAIVDPKKLLMLSRCRKCKD